MPGRPARGYHPSMPWLSYSLEFGPGPCFRYWEMSQAWRFPHKGAVSPSKFSLLPCLNPDVEPSAGPGDDSSHTRTSLLSEPPKTSAKSTYCASMAIPRCARDSSTRLLQESGGESLPPRWNCTRTDWRAFALWQWDIMFTCSVAFCTMQGSVISSSFFRCAIAR